MVQSAKYRQNPDLREELLATAGKQLFECGPDPYWATGCALNSTEFEKGDFPGHNTLGKQVVEVRDDLLREQHTEDMQTT